MLYFTAFLASVDKSPHLTAHQPDLSARNFVQTAQHDEYVVQIGTSLKLLHSERMMHITNLPSVPCARNLPECHDVDC